MPQVKEGISSKSRGIAAPRVFWPAAVIIVGIVAAAILQPEAVGEALAAANKSVVNNVGWYYVLVVCAFILFSIWIAVSDSGKIVLGKDDDEPEFSLVSWFTMLFSAGMGIGLVFWGVAEPLNHFNSPPPGTPDNTAAIAREAFDTTFLHWGLHAWAIYVVIGLAVAYVVHRRGFPVSIRWALYPLLGDKVKGWFGDLVDVLAIVGTMFGVATSLGFGVKQVGAGLEHVGAIETATNTVLVVLIVAITAVAIVSVVTGVDKGIKYLSNLNIGLAVVLLSAVFILGPTLFIVTDFAQSLGSYFSRIIELSFRTFAFEGEEGQAWLGGWTTTYWGWWVSWAPFVGIFIARISRGRSIREFVAGVLLVPTLVTFLWFAVMGGAALHREIFGDKGLIDPENGVSTNNALFQLLDPLPGGTILAVLAIVVIIIFFVTSSDSGSFVIDMLASGSQNPPIWSRVFWATMEGSVAAALLLAGGGGLKALQTMSILLAIPFTIIMILMMAGLVKALSREAREYKRAERRLLADEIAGIISRDKEKASK